MTAPELQDHVALVTGGSRGIGAAIVHALAKAGAAVAINFRDGADMANEQAAKIQAAGGRAIAVQADVADGAAVTAMFAHIASELGTVDILVNNAGIALARNVDTLTEDDFDKTIAVNLKGVFLATQAALPGMRAKRWGRIVNISSGAARGVGGTGPHYNASKAGVEGLTRGYAASLVKEGITVNAVAPTLIETDMMKPTREIVAHIPLGRPGTADEVAQAVMLLIANEYMTGQTLALSGGMSFN